MSENAVTITTRQAAELLNVHESSIKRWCSQDQLACHQTPGGHRRIPLEALMAFSISKDLSCDLHVFDEYAELIWEGLQDAHKRHDFSCLANLGAQWIQGLDFHYLLKLVTYLKAHGYSLATQMDELIAPVMRTVGEAYLRGDLSIGQEHRITYLMRDLLVKMPTKPDHALDNGPPPKVVLGCLRSQAHELGCLMAKVVLENHGWEVIYLGLNVPTEEFVKIQADYDADLVCIALMPPSTIPEVQHTVDLLEQVYNRNKPFDLVMGGPVHLALDPVRVSQSPLRSIHYFGKMADFSAWLTQASTSS